MLVILSITGRKNSGKTTLIEELLNALPDEENVAVIKHIHHKGVEFDVEGTDTWRAKKAGALVVIGLAPGRFFLNADVEIGLDEAISLVKRVAPRVKLVLLEGFYEQAKARRDVYRVVVARSKREAEELVANSHYKPQAVYCRSCPDEEVYGVPVYKSANEIANMVKSLLDHRTGERIG